MERPVWVRCIFLALLLGSTGGQTRAEDGMAPTSSVKVGVHDSAGLADGTLADAERAASFIFGQAGLEVEFVNCGRAPAGDREATAAFCNTAQFPRHLQLSIARRSKNLRDSIFGISYLGEDGIGCYSDVFFEPVLELHERLQFELGTLLGHVMAHEIAHLLLGTNSHSGSGIMRPRWDRGDVLKAGKGELLFSAEEGRAMRAKVSAGLRRADWIASRITPWDGLKPAPIDGNTDHFAEVPEPSLIV